MGVARCRCAGSGVWRVASEEELDPFARELPERWRTICWAEWQRIMEDPAYVIERPVAEWLEGRRQVVGSLDEFCELYGRPAPTTVEELVSWWERALAPRDRRRSRGWTRWAIAAGMILGHLTARN